MKSIYVDESIDVLVVSYGGAGTTMLIRFLSKYMTCNSEDDEDGLKHTDKIPVSRNKRLKTVYIFGDPIDAVCSLFRRGFFNLHSRKLLRSYDSIEPIPAQLDLREYAAQRIDRLKFQNHFDNWYKQNHYFPIFFIKYEKLWDNLHHLFKFVGIPSTELSQFPKKKPREINPLDASDVLRSDLNKMYGNFALELNGYPATRIVLPKQPMGYRKIDLIMSLGPYLAFKCKSFLKSVLPVRFILWMAR